MRSEGFGHVERARRDKEHVVGFDLTVAGVDLRALDDGQEVALDALAGNVRAARVVVPRDFVKLIQKDDTRVFGAEDGFVGDLVAVYQLVGLLALQGFTRLADARLAAHTLFGHEV